MTRKVLEWERALLWYVSALFVFETLTGLAVYLLPFSVPNQMMVLFHTVAGVAMVVPFAVYQVRHWRLYSQIRVSHVKLTGYFAMAATVVLIVSGLVLTAQAMFATRISRAWDFVHIVATFALLGSLVPHVATMLMRVVRAKAAVAVTPVRLASRRFAVGTVSLTLALFALVAIATAFHRAPELVNELPKDYSYAFGPERPFAPSLARTSSGHKRIYDEWAASAHRYSAMDPAFQKVQTVMAEQNGPESTRDCGGCHDPISLFSGGEEHLRGGSHQSDRVSGRRLLHRLSRDQGDRRQGKRSVRHHAAQPLHVRARGGRRRAHDQ